MNNISQLIRNYCYETQQAAMSVVLNLRDLRNDPDFFQKVSQVAFASLQLVMMRYPGASNLNRLAFVFVNTANMHDFYRVILYPRQYFFPVTADSIDENVVLNDFTDFLYSQFNPDHEEIDPTDGADEWNALHEIAKECLGAQLKQMRSNGDAYRNFDDFKEVLEKRLKNTEDDGYNVSVIDLDDLEVTPEWTRHVPFLARITNYNWLLVDIGCVGLCFQGWNLVDTAQWADRIGQYPGFQWVKNQQLETWVIGLVFSAFALKVVEATRKLQDDSLTPQEIRQARWDVITSFAESVLFGAIFLNLIGKTKIDNVYLQWFAIGAKSLGLLSIAIRPQHEFFEEPV